MRTETFGQRIARGRAGFTGAIPSLVNRWRIAALDRAEARRPHEGPTTAERRHDLIAFYNRYEELVDIICDAAHYGPTTSSRGQYLNLQQWMRANYGSIEPYVTTYLQHGISQGDPFQKLISCDELDELLMSDDGSMICHINQTREALNLYAEHLRQLAARHG